MQWLCECCTECTTCPQVPAWGFRNKSFKSRSDVLNVLHVMANVEELHVVPRFTFVDCGYLWKQFCSGFVHNVFLFFFYFCLFISSTSAYAESSPIHRWININFNGCWSTAIPLNKTSPIQIDIKFSIYIEE
jgi:hypothetical protein